MPSINPDSSAEKGVEMINRGHGARTGRPGGLTDLPEAATRDISAALQGLLADVFALYLKTKNFHWHMSGPHFRDYHLLLDGLRARAEAMITP